jgi:ATP-dependent DNA helicase RecG
MRPDILSPLFAPLDTLAGVGPKTARLYDKLLDRIEGGARLVDLLFHLPRGLIDRRLKPGIARAPEGAIVTLKVRVDRHQAPPRGSRAPYRVMVQDDTGEMALVHFAAKADWMAKLYPVDATRWISGRVEWFNGRPQMVHPDHVAETEEAIPEVEPVYGLTEGLTARAIAKTAAAALARLPELPEWIDPTVKAARNWPDFADALTRAHLPAAEPDKTALARLAYDEFLAGQLALALVRADAKRGAKAPIVGDGHLRNRILAALPFSPTGSQTLAFAEIAADMAKPEKMLRLLQGDVGAGKTLVGLIAAAIAAEAGAQAAFMAPTELLARQHHATLARFGTPGGLRIALLTGREKGKERGEILADLAAGEIDLIVGTHALIQEPVVFANLRLAIIDEQHRFGVEQRLKLSAKGHGVDLLLMTATPIPRTLLMTAFGDIDVTRLTDKPAGRQKIDTRIVPVDRIGEVVARVKRAVADGAKVYWVCPLVEESEVSDLAAAEERREDLAKHLGDVVGLVHGRMKADDKDAAMADFVAGRTRVLVATTVIEVGVDVPDATIMVIEHAEQFGLAQLHQLRGRVGRGDAASHCLLLYKGPLTETARARLQIMRDSDDGFVIAEEDLKLRGGGEVLGTRQSGLPGFRLAQLETHADLLPIARDDARLVLARDPGLASERGRALRVALYLFERDVGVRLLAAG